MIEFHLRRRRNSSAEGVYGKVPDVPTLGNSPVCVLSTWSGGVDLAKERHYGVSILFCHLWHGEIEPINLATHDVELCDICPGRIGRPVQTAVIDQEAEGIRTVDIDLFRDAPLGAA